MIGKEKYVPICLIEVLLTVSKNTIYFGLDFFLRKSDLTVTIASSDPGVYQVLLQNKGNSNSQRFSSRFLVCISAKCICVSIVLEDRCFRQAGKEMNVCD